MLCQKDKFDLEPHLHYINGAYMSPQLKSVEAAGLAAVSRKNRPYFVTPEDFFSGKKRLRALFAQLVHAPSAEHVAFIPSVSYGIGIVARNVSIKPGQTIVLTEAQFPSNVYSWLRLAEEQGAEIITVPMPETRENRGQIWNERILDAIDSSTAVVAMGHIHWATGTLFDLKAISDKVHAAGGVLVIDGTQSVGALPHDVQALGVDALICGGYKWLMGPYGFGYAYLNERFWNGVPLEENWINRENSDNFADLTNYRATYQPGALRFDVGESSNFIMVAMCTAALEQLLEWGQDRIQAYCHDLTRDAVAQWQSRGYWADDARYRAQHLFGIQLPDGADPLLLQQRLKANNILVSVRGGFVRISPNVYNDPADIAALSAVL